SSSGRLPFSHLKPTPSRRSTTAATIMATTLRKKDFWMDGRSPARRTNVLIIANPKADSRIKPIALLFLESTVFSPLSNNFPFPIVAQPCAICKWRMQLDHWAGMCYLFDSITRCCAGGAAYRLTEGFMEQEIKLTKLANCAGCGAKVGAGVLAQLLEGLPVHRDHNLLVGFDKSDDAAVYRVSDELALVQTVDFFPPIADDPYLFGQIAAANALSDV